MPALVKSLPDGCCSLLLPHLISYKALNYDASLAGDRKACPVHGEGTETGRQSPVDWSHPMIDKARRGCRAHSDQ